MSRQFTTAGVLVVHPTGNANSRAVLSALEASGDLRAYATTLDFRGFALGRVGVVPAVRPAPLPRDRVWRSPQRELVRLALRSAPVARARRSTESAQRFGIEWVSAGLGRFAARRLQHDEQIDLVYTYAAHALTVLRAANALGAQSVLELQHVHWRATNRAIEDTRARYPAWAPTLPRLISSALEAQSDEEVRLATAVVSPSGQVSNSIRELDPFKRIVELPYGCPEPSPGAVRRARNLRPSRPLRLLFAGRVVALKGVPELAEALSALGSRVELTVVGRRPSVDCEPLDRFLSRARYLGPIPRERLLAEMREADLLVLPSIVEGRSLVVLEALSQGLPVVTTDGSGASDLVGQGAGLVVPIGDADALARALSELDESRERLDDMAAIGLEQARTNSWRKFEMDLVRELGKLRVDAVQD